MVKERLDALKRARDEVLNPSRNANYRTWWQIAALDLLNYVEILEDENRRLSGDVTQEHTPKVD